MPKLDSPLELSPVFKPKMWGRRDLAPLYPDSWTTHRGNVIRIHQPRRASLEDKLIGEIWLTDDEAVFLNGPLAGMSLLHACKKHGPELCGEAGSDGRFPILAKFLFTEDWLSVQVHPDDDYTREHEPGSLGKCEMWYVIHREPHAEILLGLKPGISVKDLESALRRGVSPEMLQRFRPDTGDALFVPPGAIHSLGPGLTLFEAEENSDLTYRLDDFGRKGLDGKPRPLHLKKGLEVVRPGLPVSRDLPRCERREHYGIRRFVLACPYFAVEELQLKTIASFKGNRPRVEAITVISGEGRIETAGGWYALRTGSIWLIPPATPTYRLVPEIPTRLLKLYVPDLEEDFRKPLAQAGVSAEDTNKVVFAAEERGRLG
ncbi:MAG: type I phosphomannose isomerase catalytic subunit [Terriglobia bacterium]